MTLQSLRTDSRGVSEVIGSILVFGLVVALISLLQVQAIPNANEEVEFEHSNAVTGDMAELQVAMSETVDTGQTKEAAVKLGAEYPPRLLFFNPPPASGRLETTDPATITIEHAASSGTTRDYFDEVSPVTLPTRSLNYSVRYNELSKSAERVREPTVYYKSVDSEVLVKDSSFIDDREISIVAIGGDYAKDGVEAERIKSKPLSAPAKEYTVHDDGDPITISIPTNLPMEKWDQILADEYASTTSPLTGASVPGTGYVADASYTENPGYNTLTVTMETGQEYQLRTGKVGFGNGGDPEPRYIVGVEDNDPTVATIEVRDGFNNPVSGVEVEIQGTSDTVTTGPDGQASYAPTSGKKVTFLKDFDNSGTATRPLEKVTVSILGPLDGKEPKIDQFSVDVDTTETCNSFVLSGGVLLCPGNFRTLQQPIVDFAVADDRPTDSGVAFVEIQVLDSNGDIITSKRFAGDGQAVVDSRWVAPWLDDGGSAGRSDPVEIKLIARDRSGETEIVTKSI